MNTTKIIFVRHAKAQYGEDDRTRPLTEEGLRNRAIVVETQIRPASLVKIEE